MLDPGRATLPKTLTKRLALAQNTRKDESPDKPKIKGPVITLRRAGQVEIKRMAANKDELVKRARRDLAKRLSVSEDEIEEAGIEEADFPDMALGAPDKGEMSGQMITSGWRIRLRSGKKDYEYRANQNQLRLYNFKGSNYRI